MFIVKFKIESGIIGSEHFTNCVRSCSYTFSLFQEFVCKSDCTNLVPNDKSAKVRQINLNVAISIHNLSKEVKNNFADVPCFFFCSVCHGCNLQVIYFYLWDNTAHSTQFERSNLEILVIV